MAAYPFFELLGTYTVLAVSGLFPVVWIFADLYRQAGGEVASLLLAESSDHGHHGG